MQLSTQLSYAGGFKEAAKQVGDLEKAGLDLVWVAEAYGFDGVSVMGYLAACTERVQIGAGILPLYTRTPTLLAMTAAGLDALSDGRFVLGLGASGPQVIEGFHGVPYDKPLGPHPGDHRDLPQGVGARRRRSPTTARCTTLPLPDGQGTGLGKPLKIIGRPVRARIPTYVAALGEKNVELTAEIADGWLPLFYLPERAREVFGAVARRGRRQAARRPRPARDLRWRPVHASASSHEVKAVLDMFARPMAALYIGGMGAKGRNFYNALVSPRTATRPRPPRSRISTWPARRTRPRPRCPTSCSSSRTSAVPRASSRSGSPRSRRPGSACST